MDFARIGKDEVALLAGVTSQTVAKHVHGVRFCNLLAGLPDPIAAGRGKRLLWIRQDILDWLEGQRTFRPKREDKQALPAEAKTQPVEEMPRRGRGRPPKIASKTGAAQPITQLLHTGQWRKNARNGRAD